MNRVVFSTIFLGFFLWSAAARGEGGCPDALRFVRDRHGGVLRYSGDPVRLATVLDGSVDYAAATRGAMGTHWSSATQEQRGTITGAVRALLRGAFARLGSRATGYDVTWSCDLDKRGGWSIGGTAVPRAGRGETWELEYWVVRDDEGLSIRDVSAEDVSLVASYRSQFGRIVARRGIRGLIETLQDKIEGRSVQSGVVKL